MAGQTVNDGYNNYCLNKQVLMMTIDLFEDALPPPWREEIAPGAVATTCIKLFSLLCLLLPFKLY